ncbi:MAG TPA: DNA primase [Clostridia bacterium]|nr:DNA primase [Clostridia bacterium]
MPYFPDDWKNELLSKTDIVSLVSDYVALSPKGGRFWACCPFHNEKTPSFSVRPEHQSYYCFGCHAGGGVIDFVMKAERASYVEAVTMLAERAGMELPNEAEDDRLRVQRAYKERLYAACKEAALFYHAQLKADIGAPAREYLKRRGVDWASAVRFGLGFAPDSWEAMTGHLRLKGFSDKELIDAGIGIRNKAGNGCYDAYRGRLIFPIIATNNRVLGFGARTMKKDEQPKYINTGDTAIYNKRNNLYAMNMQKGLKGELVMVEGYMDVISLHSAGVTNAVASLGTAMTKQQAQLVKRYTGSVYLCYDGDEAGQNAALRGIEILAAEGLDVRVIAIPGGLDPDDYVRKYGKDAFLRLRDGALTGNGFRLANMAAQHDLASENGREAFALKACAFVGALQPVERERYAPYIAKKTGLPVETVKLQCGMAGPAAGNIIGKNRNTRSRQQADALPEADKTERMLVSCMLTGSENAAYVAERMAAEGVDFASDGLREFADALLLAYLGGGAPDMPSLLSHLSNANAAAAVLSDEPVAGDARAVADDCLKKLAMRALEAEVDRLGRLLESAEGQERADAMERLREINKKLRKYK